MEQGTHFKHWSDNGEPLHFYGANGFPIGCYQEIINLLTKDYAVSSLYNRATWPESQPPKRINWQVYVDDLIDFLETHMNAPVIGVGHSMGGTVTLLAAIKRPDLFSKLVLIEPAMASPWLAKLLKVTPFSFKKGVQPVKFTINKPSYWKSKQAFYDDCRSRRVFKRIDDHNLSLMAEHSLVEDQKNAFRLAFPKLWEAKNYASAPNLFKQMAKVKVPIVAIRGKPSLFFTEHSWQVWQKVSPKSQFFENPKYGHLMPLESPQDCVSLIEQGLE